MSQGWTFASDPWDRDLPLDPPTTEYDRYEYQWEDWLADNYDEVTNTVFGIDYDDHQTVHDSLWERFMNEMIRDRRAD